MATLSSPAVTTLQKSSPFKLRISRMVRRDRLLPAVPSIPPAPRLRAPTNEAEWLEWPSLAGPYQPQEPPHPSPDDEQHQYRVRDSVLGASTSPQHRGTPPATTRVEDAPRGSDYVLPAKFRRGLAPAPGPMRNLSGAYEPSSIEGSTSTGSSRQLDAYHHSSSRGMPGAVDQAAIDDIKYGNLDKN
ncbi:hypothetical protein BXZ70DRAFT_1005051 [Cristinia sonorae]|uniref:Uncharacterized protein n=1 Tax=Cristinia sonorae TaxID=1940300 RepID=A0A8K0UU78_9AGAR|nr:hypothetical protein BXZ70DRAFT_1005051 [Cristinia sonorae]